MTEAPLTTTLKAPGANSPWVVIRSSNTAQLAQQLAELQNNTTFADLARANEAFTAHFTVGAVLGARGVNAPQDTGAFAPQPEPAAYAPAPEPAQYPAPAAQQQYAPPVQQYAAPPAASAPPGAPMVAGMPAKLISGASAKGPWQAWADPRPKEATEHMAKTDDVNHPGLNGGTHKLWKFIR
jgi:hypothetical protein